MSQVCILTDSTVQYPSPVFPGHELVTVIPMHIQLNGRDYLDCKDLKLISFPSSASNGIQPKLKPPSPSEFHEAIINLSELFSDIILILSSSHLTPSIPQALRTIANSALSVNVHVIDSQTISVGLGLLVKTAAEAAAHGAKAAEIEHLILGLIRHTYGIFCVQSLTYLYHSGQIDPAQALLGEMLGLAPFFLLENGRLVPVQKARNPRHMVDTFHEYISEFRTLRHMAILQGSPPFTNEARNLYERLLQDFPTTPFSEYPFSAALATLLGPRSLGLMVMES